MNQTLKLASLLLLLTVVTGCNLANMLKMRFANDELVPAWPEQLTKVNLPSFYLGEKPYVEVAINGVTGFRMLIDTGASITYLSDTQRVKNLNLMRGYDLTAKGWGDQGGTPIYQSEVQSLDLQGVAFNNVNVAVMIASSSPYFLRPDEDIFDGVLGHDILRHFTWTFDKVNNQISISSKPYSPLAEDIAVPFDIFMSKLEIEGRFDMGNGHQVEQSLLIDTGSRHYLKLSQTYIDNHDIAIPGSSVTSADFGLSGRALHQRVTLPGFNMAGLQFNNVKTNLIVTEDEDELWIVGSALLNQFVSVIDYQSETMYLRPYKNMTFQTRYNLLGLELRKIRSGEFVVRFVMPDMAAAKADFNVGDLITAINGKPSQHISLDEWLSLSDKPGEYEICRQRENIACIKVRSKHIEGYSRPAAQSLTAAK